MVALTALEAIVPSRARRALLGALFSGVAPLSVSDLARAARLTPRAVAQQVERLERAGLLVGETVGPSRLLRANRSHPAARALRALVAAAPLQVGDVDRAARRALAAYGARAADASADVRGAGAGTGLEEAVLLGLAGARRDAGFLRLLPLVLARQVASLDWERLRSLAVARGLRAELGMVLDLTADVAGLPELRLQAEPLRDGRRSRERCLPESMTPEQRVLARRNAPQAARRWKFLMDLSDPNSFHEESPAEAAKYDRMRHGRR